jgi:hypothetical protein
LLKLASGRQQEVQRSENGTFVCLCGKEFTRAHALRRHAAMCTNATVLEETANNDEDNDEGIFHFLKG